MARVTGEVKGAGSRSSTESVLVPSFLALPRLASLQGPIHLPLVRSFGHRQRVGPAGAIPVMTPKGPPGTVLPSQGGLYAHCPASACGHPTALITPHPRPHPQVRRKAQLRQNCAPTPGRRRSCLPPVHVALCPAACGAAPFSVFVCRRLHCRLATAPAIPNPLAAGPGGVEDNSSTDSGCGEGFRDGSSILPLLCTFFLSLLHLLHRRPSDLRSRSLGTPDLDHGRRRGMSAHALHHLQGARRAASAR